MGKRIEDLRTLDDTPIEHQVEVLAPTHRNDPDVRDEPWFQFVTEIEELLESGQYTWAEATLSGIRDTVASTRRVSDDQLRAVCNIAQRTLRGPRAGSRRRYEGFGSRGGR